MSACFVSMALYLPEGVEPDWTRARYAIDALPESMVRQWLDEHGFDVPPPALFASDDEKSDLRAEVRNTLMHFRNEYESATDFDVYSIRGIQMIVTGGVTHGDSPTDIAHYMSLLWDLPSVLAAANFITDNEVLAGRKDAS